MKDFFENLTDSLGDELIKGIAIALCIIMLFSGGFFFGTITSPKAAEDTAVNATEAPQTTQATTAPTTQPTKPTPVTPSTGDNFHLAICLAIMLSSMTMLVILMKKMKKVTK